MIKTKIHDIYIYIYMRRYVFSLCFFQIYLTLFIMAITLLTFNNIFKKLTHIHTNIFMCTNLYISSFLSFIPNHSTVDIHYLYFNTRNVTKYLQLCYITLWNNGIIIFIILYERMYVCWNVYVLYYMNAKAAWW